MLMPIFTLNYLSSKKKLHREDFMYDVSSFCEKYRCKYYPHGPQRADQINVCLYQTLLFHSLTKHTN